jgi:hypothetical protein
VILPTDIHQPAYDFSAVWAHVEGTGRTSPLPLASWGRGLGARE